MCHLNMEGWDVKVTLLEMGLPPSLSFPDCPRAGRLDRQGRAFHCSQPSGPGQWLRRVCGPFPRSTGGRAESQGGDVTRRLTCGSLGSRHHAGQRAHAVTPRAWVGTTHRSVCHGRSEGQAQPRPPGICAGRVPSACRPGSECARRLGRTGSPWRNRGRA